MNGDVQRGGAVLYLSASPTIDRCILFHNSAESGGGIYCNDSSIQITECEIIDNCSDRGGGIYCFEMDGWISDCTISDNYGSMDGAGLFLSHSNPVIRGTSFIKNRTNQYGGGVCCSETAGLFIQCGFLLNDVWHGGGAGAILFGSQLITSCIIWRNLPNGLQSRMANPFVRYTNVQGTPDEFPGTGNLRVAP